MRFIIIFLVLFLPVSFGVCQSKEVKFENFSVEQGLSGNLINCILQDKKGFIWIATSDGLNKFDGYKFTVFTKKRSGLSNNYIRTIFEDSNGTLWIGTKGGGLNKFNCQTETFTHYMHCPSKEGSLSNNEVLSINEDKDGTLWVGTENGLNKFDRKTGKFSSYLPEEGDPESLSAKAILSIWPDKNGIIWVGTWAGGLNKFDPKTGKAKHYFNKGADGLNVWSLFQDQDNALWLSTYGNGVIKFDPSTGASKQFPFSPNDKGLFSADVSSISSAKDGTLWIGTLGGLNEFNPQTEEFSTNLYFPHKTGKLNNVKITYVFKDKDQTLWIGSVENGLYKIDLAKEKFKSYFSSSNYSLTWNNPRITSIIKDKKGQLWLGKDQEDGLIKVKPDGQITRYSKKIADPNSLSHVFVTSLLEDRSGEIWIGTLNGLNKYNARTDNFSSFFHYSHLNKEFNDNWIEAIMEDKSGLLWVGTDAGLKGFDKHTNTFTHHYYNDPVDAKSLSHNHVLSLYEDKEGFLWIGTNGGGLNRFNKNTKQFSSFASDSLNPESLPNNFVNTIYQDKAGNMWLGTRAGLVKFDKKKGIFKAFGAKEGLANMVINGILEDKDGNLWVSTGYGISKFNIAQEKFKNYDKHDGLQSNNFFRQSCFKSQEGEMFFGGDNGYNAFFPGNIKDNPSIPPVYISDFQLFNKPVAVGKKSPLKQPLSVAKELKLSYKHSVLSFEFVALNYIASEKNQFAYKMVSFDNDWNYVGSQRKATYTNLDPGEYLFLVKASNNDGVWNSTGASIKLTITPPFWLTWWFRISAGVALVGSLFAFYSFRINNIKKQKIELSRQVMERTEEIRSQAKEIERMNALLMEHNKKLEVHVEDITKARVMQKRLTFDEFKEIFPHDEACLKYLSELKWTKGFSCKKCENEFYSPWKAPYSRRCTKCNYIESATAFTIFHSLKFSVLKAFYMVFLIYSKKIITAEELSVIVEISSKTCNTFKRKIIQLESERKLKKNSSWEDLIVLQEVSTKPSYLKVAKTEAMALK